MKSIAVTIAVLTLVGCSRKSTSTAVDESEVEAFVQTTARAYEISGKSVNKKAVKNATSRMAARIEDKLSSIKLIDAELKKLGIEPTIESDNEVIKKYQKALRLDNATLDEIASRFGKLEDHFKKTFERESRFLAYAMSQKVDIATEDEIDSCLREAKMKLKMCQRIDMAAYAKMDLICKRLENGEKWEVVAEECSEDALLDESYADNWKHWQTVNIRKVEPEELIDELKRLDIGQFTKPIVSDEGLEIVKLDEIYEDIVTLSRIIVRMAVNYDVPSRDEIVNSIRQKKIDAFYNKLALKLKRRSK